MLAVSVLLLTMAGCGARATAAPRPDPLAPRAGVVGDPTDGGQRRADVGDRCDHGGAADLTCERGLFCCYGPPDNPGTFGQCQIECPSY
jgi:hypothetical protein